MDDYAVTLTYTVMVSVRVPSGTKPEAVAKMAAATVTTTSDIDLVTVEEVTLKETSEPFSF